MNKTISCFLLFALLFSSCKSDFEDLEVESWEPILAIPLVKSEITVDDVLTELNHPEEVLILENGIVALNYKGDLISFNPESVLEVEDQNFSETVVLGATEASVLDLSDVPVNFPVNVPIVIELEPSEVQVAEILISNGTLNLSLTRVQDENVTGELTIPELVDANMVPLTFMVAGDQPVNQAEELSVDISGYTLSPTFIPPFTNQMSVSGVLALSNNELNTAVAGDFLTVEFEMVDLMFEHITGDFGNLILSGDSDTITVNLFENIESGSFSLTNAIISFGVTNSFGLPFDIELGEVVSVNQNSGVEAQLFLSDISLNGQEALGGAPESQVFVFDNNNSDITSLFEPAPVDVVFDIEATANPNGPPPPDDLNFITNESAFDIDIDLILPLEGYALDVLISDTLDMSISFDDFTEIDSLEFRLNTKNGFPLDVQFQAYFLDANFVVMDSLFLQEELIMLSAITNTDGDVVSPSEEITFFTFQNQRAESLQDVEKVHFTALFNTSESATEEIVRIKSEQTIDIELGVKIFGNAEL